MPLLLEAVALSKSFAGVPALRGASLTANVGEVHALVGENGAGKTTLVRILSGALRQDSGQVLWHGREPRRIAVAHQEPMLAPHLTVAENLWLGREPQRARVLLDNRAAQAKARSFLAEHHFNLEADVPAGRLSAAQRQILELARALAGEPDLLILDEPTSSLSEAESQEVLRTVTRLRELGKSVIYISHRLEEIRQVALRVTVLRDGETVYSGDLAEVSTADLVRHMAGRAIALGARFPKRAPGEELFRVEGEATFALHAGEIVGLAGLVGAGRTELCLALFGLAPQEPASGRRVFMGGRQVCIRSPRQAAGAGLAYLTEDRQRSGLLRRRPVRENMTLAALPRLSPLGLLALHRERLLVQEKIEKLGIRGSAEQRMETLSGGNQQKALLARWMLTQARVFLLDEPTRGIDVAAKAEVFNLMDELSRQGAAVLMVSSEIPELLEVCDRLLVMRAGRIVRELDPATATREEVLHWAL